MHAFIFHPAGSGGQSNYLNVSSVVVLVIKVGKGKSKWELVKLGLIS